MPVVTASSTQAHRLLTAEELWQHGPSTPGELIRGTFVDMPPTGHPHGSIEANVAGELRAFVRRRRLGKVMTGEIGIITQRDPDTVRGADVAYVSKERLARAKSDGYLDVAPDLVVEVVSPNDRWTDINEKVDEYLACGVRAVWIIDPRTERITCYRPSSALRIYGKDDALTEPDLLPGFSVPVRELFE